MTRIDIGAAFPAHTIDPNIYGHFSEHLGRCIYEGIWVGPDSPIPNTEGIRNDVIDAMKQMKIPVLRWPGGCFADEYHWKDGIGPKETRKRMINTHWGGVVENNHFGTHEFLRFCELIGAEPYICGNVGSGTVQEMSEWVEYMTFDGESPMANLRRENGQETPWKVKFFGVGNENWGCGGDMRPEYYADLYRRYACYCRNYGDNKLFRIACGPNAEDYHWTEVMMRQAKDKMHGLSLHYYTLPTGKWNDKGPSVEFGEAEWFETLRRTLFMEELLKRHSAIMDAHDPEKKVALIVDEWGTWYNVEPGTNPGFLYQQNTLRDALVAGINLNLFHHYGERVRMANIAQLVNVLQSVILTEGASMILTPTYHVFEMYKVHQGARYLPLNMVSPAYAMGDQSIPQISASASVTDQGKINITLCNLHHADAAELELNLGMAVTGTVTGSVVSGDTLNAHNTFDAPEVVTKKAFTDIRVENGVLKTRLPAHAVVLIEVNN